jgi:hypothetical protein
MERSQRMAGVRGYGPLDGNALRSDGSWRLGAMGGGAKLLQRHQQLTVFMYLRAAPGLGPRNVFWPFLGAGVDAS